MFFSFWFKSLCMTVSRSIHVSCKYIFKTFIQKSFMIKRLFYVERGKHTKIVLYRAGWERKIQEKYPYFVTVLFFFFFLVILVFPFFYFWIWTYTQSCHFPSWIYCDSSFVPVITLTIFLLVQCLLSSHSPICWNSW